MKILLIQSRADDRKAAAEFLRKAGFLVDEASSGLEATFMLYNQARFDLLIYDANLSDRDRVTFAAALRSSHALIPIIAMSAFPWLTADRVLFQGPMEFIKTPISFDQLLSSAMRLVPKLCRRKIGTQTWHVCTNCKDWPDSNFEEMMANPLDHVELCNECRLKYSQGNRL